MSKVTNASYLAEAEAGFTNRTAMEEAARCLLCHDAPCSKGCPAGTNPAKFIRSIRFRNVDGAIETIRENNILGGTCARVCPYDRLCEEACSRCGIDKPIQIGKLQRYAIEQEQLQGLQILQAPETKLPGKVVCIGAGPASLACAAELAKAGYDVTILEKEAKAGGVLTYGIAPSRLPEEVVEHDVAQVANLGVKFEFNKTATAADLADYDAVFLGTGLWAAQVPAIEGTDLKNVYSAVDFLKCARTQKDAFQVGKRVVVVGGGDVAVDCAVTAKLLGAEQVRIVYRRSIAEAPARMEELQYALSLGIGMVTEMAPAKLLGSDQVEKAVFTGREGDSESAFAVDTVVFAIGQGAEDMGALTSAQLSDKGLIVADENGATSQPGVFAAGDIVHGGKTVVEAVAAGKKAASAILKHLENREDA